ncbi:MAG: nucleotidyltransferase domain-containing protein [Cyanobacteria bacterium P01_D01_bin.1]
MKRHVLEAELAPDGTVLLRDLPFQPGDSVEITVVKQVEDTKPFISEDAPKDWRNANPRYWIRTAAERISEKFDPEKIILFGSYAKGTATVHSDIDLLVVFKDVDDKRERAIAIQRLLTDSPISEDIIVATEQDIEKYKYSVSSVLRFATEEGKVIYERAQ